ncbi:hypothetical protein JHK82_033152 [Glycine max]|nr:hypothetical protein JHK85_033868 [Glycine max]KAG5118732.1 hypothetical protein JHK82_033152 [Glycine max]
MSPRGGSKQQPDSRRQAPPSAAAAVPSPPGRGRGRGRGESSVPAPSLVNAPSAPPPASTIGVPSGAAPFRAALPPPAVESLTSAVEKQLTMQPSAPSSSKAVRFKERPGFGLAGEKIKVRANHFQVQVAEQDLFHYDVSINPEITSKKVSRDVMTLLVQAHREKILGNRIPAYDGGKSLFTAGSLPFESKDFVIVLKDDDEPGSSSSSSPTRKKREREYRVTIRLASRTDIHHLSQFLRRRQLDCPYETIQALDVVLRATPSERFVVVGRSFFSPSLGKPGSLGSGTEYWRGYYQSLRPTQMGLSLNINVSARAFYEPIPVIDFIESHFRANPSRPLPDQDRIKLKRVLRGVKVEVTHGKNLRRYKITGVTKEQLRKLMFTLDDNRTKSSVVQYFHEKYNIVLKHTLLPALQAGSDIKPIFLPMELCQIVAGQRYTKRLNEEQVTNLLRASCQRPRDRENSIRQVVRQSNFSTDKFVSHFGIQVREDPALLDARVLPAPMLKYHDTGRESSVEPKMGQWNMIDKVGGSNTVLNDAIARIIPRVSDRPTLILGADVTHPQPGEDSSPSIAAVVASMDWPYVTRYRGVVSAQTHREEIIQDLYNTCEDPVKGKVHSGIIRELLRAFHLSTNQKPERIIFYRDGVSEGQFSQVLLYEMDAIRRACASLQEGYLPRVTFVVVQKRHHTRLFPVDHGSHDQTNKSGNIMPVPPVYYAHLAAFRARCYIEVATSDSGSASGGRAANCEVRLPSVKENVKDVMFFC